MTPNELPTNAGLFRFTDEELARATAYAENLLRIYADAPAEARTEGLAWYQEAAAFCQQVATNTGQPFDVVAAIVAVCSTRMRWERQVEHTEPMIRHFLAGGSVADAPHGSTLPREREKARRILFGDRSALHGHKVEAFYANIMQQYHLVTLDSWAVGACAGERVSKVRFHQLVSGIRKRRTLEAAYHAAANKVGEQVAVFQAVVWCAARNHGLLPHPTRESSAS